MPKTRRSGRANLLTGQIGEYVVAAELARQGLLATTFAGNVPHYDIVASDVSGRHVSVQVKATTRNSWQFSMDRFCDVHFRGNRQILGKAHPTPVRRLVTVLVMLGARGVADRYFVTSWLQLRKVAISHHREWLRQHGGRRPKNPLSLHTAISASLLGRYENCWNTVERSLR